MPCVPCTRCAHCPCRSPTKWYIKIMRRMQIKAMTFKQRRRLWMWNGKRNKLGKVGPAALKRAAWPVPPLPHGPCHRCYNTAPGFPGSNGSGSPAATAPTASLEPTDSAASNLRKPQNGSRGRGATEGVAAVSRGHSNSLRTLLSALCGPRSARHVYRRAQAHRERARGGESSGCSGTSIAPSSAECTLTGHESGCRRFGLPCYFCYKCISPTTRPTLS